MSTRKGISRSTRFRILSRDGFKCRYCGRASSAVVLEVDHIFPVAGGGTNEDENLLAACEDCNGGKGAKVIAANSPNFASDEGRLASIREQRRAAQIAASIRSETQELRQELVDFLCAKTGRDSISHGTVNVLASFVKTHGAKLVFEWIEIASCHVPGCSESRLCRYVCGIRRRYLEEQQCPAE